MVEEQGKFERAYNFRFEEPDDEYVSLRRKYVWFGNQLNKLHMIKLKIEHMKLIY